MALTDSAGRWVKDRLSDDPDIKETPEKSAKRLAGAIEKLSAEERQKNLQHLRAYSDLYYQGRHNMAVPKEMTEELKRLEERAQRLNTVDRARGVVQQFGGPPSEQSLNEALERSQAQRVQVQPRPLPVDIQPQAAQQVGRDADSLRPNGMAQTPKVAVEMTSAEIAKEARQLHGRFQQLSARYEGASGEQRAQIREQMQPVVEREHELRKEFMGRLNPEVKQDRVPEQSIGYGR